MANASNITERGSDGISFEKPIPASQPGDTFPAGAVILHAGGNVPTGWAVCDGSTVSRSGFPVYAAQMASDGYPWGAGDGSTTVHIPDMRDRVPVGKSATKALGSSGGAETHVLTTAEMPVHTHSMGNHTHATTDPGHDHGGLTGNNAPSWSGSVDLYNNGAGAGVGRVQGSLVSSGPYSSATVVGSVALHGHTINTAFTGVTINSANPGDTVASGSGSAHSIMQPYKGINYIIRLY